MIFFSDTLIPQASHWDAEVKHGTKLEWIVIILILVEAQSLQKKSDEFGEVRGVRGILVVLSTIYKEAFHMKGPCLKMG